MENNPGFEKTSRRAFMTQIAGTAVDSTKEINASVKLPDAGKLALVTPEQPDIVPAPGVVTVPARSAAVLLEH